MLLKEIFSKKRKIFSKLLDKKAFNQKMYEKSYIRGPLIDCNSVYRLDNNSSFFNIKRKNLKKKRRIITKRKKSSRIWANLYKVKRIKNKRVGYKGSSSYTTTSLYRNRKINFIRFQLPLCNVQTSSSFVESFLKGLKKLVTGKIKEEQNTLILLNAKKGGFNCYSSGFRGFLSKKQFEIILLMWSKGLKKSKSLLSFNSIRCFILSQKFHWSISPPPRFNFKIKTIVRTLRLRRKKFVLSRKKKSFLLTKMLPKIIFFSTLSHSKIDVLNYWKFKSMINRKKRSAAKFSSKYEKLWYTKHSNQSFGFSNKRKK